MVRRAVFWSFSSQVASFFIQFVTSIVVSRILTPHQMGVYAVALAVTGIVQLFGAFSVGTFVLREELLTEHTLDTAFTINTAICAGLSLTILLVSLASASLFSDPVVPGVIRLLALTPLFSIPTFRPITMLGRTMQLRGTSLVSTLGLLTTSVTTIVLAHHGHGAISLAYGSLAGAAGTAVGTVLVGRGHNSYRLSLQGWRPMLLFGLRLMSIGGIASAAQRASDMSIAYFLSLEALGLFSRATSLSNSIFLNLYGAATRVVFARLSEAKRNGEDVGLVYLHSYRVISAMTAPVLLGVAALARPIVHLLYGNAWTGAATPLLFLMLAEVLSLVFAMNWELFVLRDELRTQTRLELIRSINNVVGRTIGANFGLLWASFSAIVESTISIFLYQPLMPRLSGLRPGVLHRAYAEMLALGAVAALPCFVVMALHHWSFTTPLPLLGLSVALGIGLWGALLIRLGHPLCAETARLLVKVNLPVPAILHDPR